MLFRSSKFRDLQSRAGPDLPRYAAGLGGAVKTSAAWLIEHAGFEKGYSLGPAGISTKHTLAIVNKGGASAQDIMRLAQEIQDRVYREFGVYLVPEPVFVGLDSF